jgi:arylsulfotransferase ASST
MPDSRGNSPWNNIALREGRVIDRATLGRLSVIATGSISGSHPGRLVLSDDDRTLVFTPNQPFALNETVTVRLDQGAPSALPPLEFSFAVSGADLRRAPHVDAEDAEEESPEIAGSRERIAPPRAATQRSAASDLPSTYPDVSILVSNNPDPGYVFCTPTNRSTNPVQTRNMLILDNYAMPIYYRWHGSQVFDFKKVDDGRLVYYDRGAGKLKYYALNSMYAVVDSFKMGNGYTTDFHDIEMLPNNHALLMAYDPQPVDMSQVVPGGDPNATVSGLIIQEIDAAKNVIFQWRSWDHFQITDVTDCHSLTTPTVDAVHGNSLDEDTDGNILLSSRYLDEITKINRQTGDIIWRFGKNARNNQFTIQDDPLGFSDQHDARRLPNGHITLFDNHSCANQAPNNSRALEYEIDEQNMTARLVWEYRHTPDQHTGPTGNTQRRASGGTMIGWGSVPGPPNITDLHADGSTAWEIQFWPPPTLTGGYRAFRFPWRATVFTPDVDDLGFGPVVVADSSILPLTVTNNSAAAVTFTSFVTLDAAFSVQEAVPLTVPAGGNVTLHVRFQPGAVGNFASVLYLRSATSTEVIAYPVTVHGSGYQVATVLMTVLEAGWGVDGVEVRWRFAGDATIVASSVERSEDAGGQWVAVDGERRQDGERELLIDRTAVVGRAYQYRIVGTMTDGKRVVSNPVGVSSAARLEVSPTPSSGETRIAYFLPREARIRVSVLDAQGRSVAVLASGWVPAGHYRADWDGRGPRGAAPAGLYFVRLDGLERPLVHRVVIAR